MEWSSFSESINHVDWLFSLDLLRHPRQGALDRAHGLENLKVGPSAPVSTQKTYYGGNSQVLQNGDRTLKYSAAQCSSPAVGMIRRLTLISQKNTAFLRAHNGRHLNNLSNALLGRILYCHSQAPELGPILPCLQLVLFLWLLSGTQDCRISSRKAYQLDGNQQQ